MPCWQQQSAGVITAQSAQTPSDCHCQGPVIRYDTPNGYLGRMATINYHSSSLSSPSIPLILSLHLLYILSHSFIAGAFFICSPGPRFAPSPFSDSAEQQWIHTSPKGQVEEEGEALRWKTIVSACLPGGYAMQSMLEPASRY